MLKDFINECNNSPDIKSYAILDKDETLMASKGEAERRLHDAFVAIAQYAENIGTAFGVERLINVIFTGRDDQYIFGTIDSGDEVVRAVFHGNSNVDLEHLLERLQADTLSKRPGELTSVSRGDPPSPPPPKGRTLMYRGRVVPGSLLPGSGAPDDEPKR